MNTRNYLEYTLEAGRRIVSRMIHFTVARFKEYGSVSYGAGTATVDFSRSNFMAISGMQMPGISKIVLKNPGTVARYELLIHRNTIENNLSISLESDVPAPIAWPYGAPDFTAGLPGQQMLISLRWDGQVYVGIQTPWYGNPANYSNVSFLVRHNFSPLPGALVSIGNIISAVTTTDGMVTFSLEKGTSYPYLIRYLDDPSLGELSGNTGLITLDNHPLITRDFAQQ